MFVEGRVKWFNNERGYGFIECAQYAEDIMAHYSEIKTPGFRKLKQGQLVTFEVHQDKNGLRAKSISPVPKPTL
jgi:CspA family cold shock protein